MKVKQTCAYFEKTKLHIQIFRAGGQKKWMQVLTAASFTAWSPLMQYGPSQA